MKKEWKLLSRSYYNHCTPRNGRSIIVELTFDNAEISVILPEDELNFESNGDFYGFANRNILTSVHVIPNELLEFDVCSYISRENKTKVKIQKVCSNQYSVAVYSKGYISGGGYCPPKDINEVLDKAELTKKLANIKDVFNPYPFLVLPLGNCFDES